MITRLACKEDIPRILKLLEQVNLVHHILRPDLFKLGTKYDFETIENMLSDESRPIMVALDEDETVLGYGFMMITVHKNDAYLFDHVNCYIDDICVDEKCRKMHVGKTIYEAIVEYAKRRGCYNITLNVWEGNDAAKSFYESCGMGVQKTVMETIL